MMKLLLNGLWTVAVKGEAEVSKLRGRKPAPERDIMILLIFAVVIFIAQWGVRCLIIEPLVRRTLTVNRARVEKFAQSTMEMIMYGSFTIMGALVVPRQEWAWPSYQWWDGWKEGTHAIMRADLQCYYLLYCARYFQGGFSVLLEHKRKDFIEMLIHHVITCLLISVSYSFGWNRVGAIIMFIFDPADVPLHMAKQCKYAADATGKATWQQLADWFFVAFGVVFALTRLVLYPYVCWSAHFETGQYLPKGGPEWFAVVLLYMLLALQIYWFSLVLRVAYKLLIQGAVEDVRSDDEDESPPKEGKTNKKEN